MPENGKYYLNGRNFNILHFFKFFILVENIRVKSFKNRLNDALRNEKDKDCAFETLMNGHFFTTYLPEFR